MNKAVFLLPILPIAVAALALAGWVLDSDFLRQGITSSVAMNPATTAGFILLGLEALRRLAGNNHSTLNRAGLFAIWVVIIATAMKLSDLMLGTSFAIDQQLFATKLDGDGAHPNRMAPNTAFCFFLLGWALFMMRSRSKAIILAAQALTAVSVVIALLALVGHLYGVSSLLGIGVYIPMAFNTAIAFLSLSMAVLFIHPDRGFMRVYTDGGPAGKIASILLPATLIAPILLGWISVNAQRAGILSSPFDLALTVVLTVAIFFTLSYISVRSLFFSDLQRQKAINELRDSAARIHAIVDTVVDGIITIDAQGVVETFNPAAERIFGYTAAEVIGRNVNMLMPEPYSTQHDGYLEHYRATGEARIIGTMRTVEGRRKDGSSFPLELAVNRMQLGGGVFFTGIVRDITARKQTEDELRASEEKYRTLFESMDEGFCVVEMLYDQHGTAVDYRFVEINPAFERQTGLQLALGKTILQLVPDHDAHWFEIFGKVARTGEAIRIEQLASGMRRYYDVFAYRIGGDGSQKVGILFQDITKRKQAEQELVAAKNAAELANRTKDSFLATMSHEIRTPLTGMLGMLELLSMSHLGKEQLATLNAAWDSGRGLLRIVSDILDWSKIEEGKLQLSLQATSIPQLLQEVVNTYSRVASAKSLMLWQSADSRLSPAHIVDPLRLSQVLNNFVSNAIKFTQRGQVQLRAERIELCDSGERICFSVKDTGAGIAKETQEHLFQRYRQESSDTARLYGGTGLGLAICRRLAELMDGQIALESEPGQGSTFSITLILPISGVPGARLQSLHPEVEHRTVKPLLGGGADAPLVLAVDDHPINRDLLASQIKLLGLRAETAENGQVALSMWQNGCFALVITDCHMPEMDGYTLSREIRRIEAEEARPRTPIIAWTANALSEESERCQTAGMDELLVKPAGMVQLRTILAKCLSIAETDSSQLAAESHKAGDSQHNPIDYSLLKQVVPDSRARMQVLHDFQVHIRADLARLLETLEQGDQANAHNTAHRMKGSSQMVGARDLAKACAAIEQAARDGNMAAARAAMSALDEAVRQLEASLAEAGKCGGATDEDQ